MKKYIYLLLFYLTQAFAAVPSTQSWNYPQALGWVSAPNDYNICNGYYRDFEIPFTPNPLTDSQEKSYDITADHITYSLKGTSIFRQNVRVTQPDKQLDADLAYLHRDPKTQKVNTIDLKGNVRLFELGKVLVGQSGHIDTTKNTLLVKNAAYRMMSEDPEHTNQPIKSTAANGKTEYRRYGLNYWGHAKSIEQTSPHHYTFKHSTYSTCPPTGTCTWHLQASTVNLDREKSVGKAWNSILWIKKAPVFYFPYVSFPLNHDRKSGFLNPTYAHTSRSGLTFSAPYYWNIAPNYDATLTPTYMEKRGFMMTGLFRYLTKEGHGQFAASVLPHDQEFAHFKNDPKTLSKYASQPEGLDNLKNDSDTRFGIHWSDEHQFSKSWSSDVDYNYVSDDYYVDDLGGGSINSSNNQLYQHANIQYQGQHWSFTGLLQNYQTLHPVNEQSVANQYARLPELTATALYPEFFGNFNFSMDSSAVDFFQEKAPDASGPKPVIGGRFNISPSIEYPFYPVYGYLVPRVQMHLTQYALNHEGIGQPNNPTQGIPSFDLHGGLYFNRDFAWFDHDYRQTLEPEAYYLYVPYYNQNDLPVFDTSTQPFTYNFMFLDNRFSGIDRIGDTNQMTLALTSRLIDEMTGNEKASISVGEILYFADRRVTLCSSSNNADCRPNTLDQRALSPVAGQATYNFTDAISGTANLTWDQYAKEFSYESATFTYKKSRHIVNFTYDLIRSGGTIAGNATNASSNELQQVNLSGEWFFKKHWDLLGRWNYSWSGNSTDNHANAYLAGIQYDSCCWAIRLIGARTFKGIDNRNRNEFDDEIYLQLDLKGFGSIGTDDPSNLLTSSIDGYKDTFDPAIV